MAYIDRYDPQTLEYLGRELMTEEAREILSENPADGSRSSAPSSREDAILRPRCECTHRYHWHFEYDSLPSGRTGCGLMGCDCEYYRPTTEKTTAED